ncbi:ABC transporter permease [Roseomonas sp. HJA6]|uniref:ABC transporter permease n=1 Tax=Roseomonas alba TaxID=2846776 RepID=A0ABS7A432_9PROT|nr:ABC transporter permease [Neoroseomonas alba]MBW6397057.1 ABC transporter permease [Neoroseomonas alba]
MMNPWPVAGAALRRRPWTSAALALLVALAVALGVAVGAVERGVRRGSIGAVVGFDLVVGAAGSPTQLVLSSVFLRPEAIPLMPGTRLQELLAAPGVRWASPIGFGDSWRGYPVVGVTADFVTRGGRRAPASGRIFAAPFEAVVGSAVPLKDGEEFEPGHGHTEQDEAPHGHEGSDYTVVGRLPPQGTAWDRAILVPIESVWELHGLGMGHGGDETRIGPPWVEPPGVPAVAVTPVSIADAYRLRGQFRSGASTAVFPAEVLVPLLRALGDVRGLLAGMAWGGFALVLAAVFLALSANFLARRRDFAVLRAIGAPPGYVAGAAWLEAGTILGLGVTAGLPLGWLMAAGAGMLAGGALDLQVAAQPDWEDALAPVAALAVGLVAAALPALAMGRRPVEADLRR